MTQPVTRKALELWNSLPDSEQKEAEVTVEGLRVRLLQKKNVPLVQDCSVFTDDLLVFDLPSNEKPRSQSPILENCAKRAKISDSDELYAGAPLKYHFYDWTQDGIDSAYNRRYFTATDYFACNPIPVRSAFIARTKLGSATLDASLKTLPILLVVDGRDDMNTALVSLHNEKNRVVNTHTRFLGLFDKKVEDSLTILSQRFRHLQYSSKATAVFNSGSIPATMHMSFSWTAHVTPNTSFAIPMSSAKTMVHCAPGWRDHRVGLDLFDSTRSLDQLLTLAHALGDNNSMQWQNTEDSEELTETTKNVKELISSCNRGRNEKCEDNERFVDFTERLWDALRNCSCEKNLIAALKIVFDALRRMEINTVLHNDNKSTLARLIRDSLAGDLHLPRLEAKTPLEILLEIGVEKFRRDLVQQFVCHGFVACPSELDAWLGNADSVEQKVYGFLPLHRALMTILQICSYLDLGTHGVASLTRRVLSKYTSTKLEDLPYVSFSTEVQYTDVKQNQFEFTKPSLWINETTYTTNNVAVAKVITHFTKSTKFEHLENIANEFIPQEENKVATDENKDYRSSYLCSLLTASFSTMIN